MRISSQICLIIVHLIGLPTIGMARELDCAEILIASKNTGVPAEDKREGLSIPAALSKMREWRRAEPNKRICLTFQAEVYQLTDTLRIGREEAGSAQATTILQKFIPVQLF